MEGLGVKGNQSRIWTTFIECINASGDALTPAVIFKGTHIQKQWFEQEFKYPWHFTCSENGWTSNEIALEWLKSVFILQSQPQDLFDMRLLVVNGHGSHTMDEFMWECFQNNIYLLCLPPHTSHVLQPLDLAVFSPLKTVYRTQIGLLASQNDSAPVGKLNFLRCFAKARDEAINIRNIKSGFRASGIWPRNRYKALNSPQVLAPERPTTPPPPQALQGVETPKKGADIMKFNKSSSPGTRLAFRKAAYTFDSLVIENELQRAKIHKLEERVKDLQPKKRQKIAAQPNERFVTI